MNAATTQRTIGLSHLTWPAIVAVLLAGHVVIVSGALLLSSVRIPGASAEPAGYASGLTWDDRQSLRDESRRLGWSLEVTPTERTELNGDRHVCFVLRDAEGEPIPDALLRVTIYHHSRPDRPIETVFESPFDAAGERTSVLDVGREGLWRLSAIAERGDDRFFAEDDFWISNPTGAPR